MPTDETRGRFVCTRQDPWDRSRAKGERVDHPDAVYLHEQPGLFGERMATYRCRHCRTVFSLTIADQ
jgi:hypothetical protein